jgi:ADP-heptose:LPS heptosyltransferase
VNLQYGEVSKEIINLRSELGTEVLEMPGLDLFSDIDGLAALISACDFVISIDNLTPHVAGALGVNTMLLLPKAADERWGLEPGKSYLYDSVNLYRQSSYNNWSEPLKNIKEDIENLYFKN